MKTTITFYYYPENINPKELIVPDWAIHVGDMGTPKNAIAIYELELEFDLPSEEKVRLDAVQGLEEELKLEIAQSVVRQNNLEAKIRGFQALSHLPSE